MIFSVSRFFVPALVHVRQEADIGCGCGGGKFSPRRSSGTPVTISGRRVSAAAEPACTTASAAQVIQSRIAQRRAQNSSAGRSDVFVLADLIIKKRPDRPASDEPRRPSTSWLDNRFGFLSTMAVGTSDEAFRKCPQLYRIANFVSATVQSVPWYCEADPDVVTMDRAGPSAVKAINDLLKAPNDIFTRTNMRYWIALNLMLYGARISKWALAPRPAIPTASIRSLPSTLVACPTTAVRSMATSTAWLSATHDQCRPGGLPRRASRHRLWSGDLFSQPHRAGRVQSSTGGDREPLSADLDPSLR